jgi:hypothetical protein
MGRFPICQSMRAMAILRQGSSPTQAMEIFQNCAIVNRRSLASVGMLLVSSTAMTVLTCFGREITVKEPSDETSPVS